MSDPPAKPKVGSLRDRIAAFEKPSSSSPTPSSGPPPPRPKPGGISWKPKQLTPPSSPNPSSAPGGDGEKKPGGMSASDARQTIGIGGGSLKERMAALQGKGGFGSSPASPPPPTSPKPAAEKPKWKPPPAPVALSDAEDEPKLKDKAIENREEGVEVERQKDERQKDEQGTVPEIAESEEKGTEGKAEEEPEVDPEEEERRRRAELAARMARLGGARVGMGPPVFGKPTIRKKETPKEEEPPKLETKPVSPTTSAIPAEEDISESKDVLYKEEHPIHDNDDKKAATSPPAVTAPTTDVKTSDGYFPTGAPSTKSTETLPDSSSLLSPEMSPPSVSPSPRSPNAMPMSAIPRRALPPRKRAKSPVPSPQPEPVQETNEAKEESVVDKVVAADEQSEERDVREPAEPQKETAEVKDDEPESKAEEPSPATHSSPTATPAVPEPPTNVEETTSHDAPHTTSHDDDATTHIDEDLGTPSPAKAEFPSTTQVVEQEKEAEEAEKDRELQPQPVAETKHDKDEVQLEVEDDPEARKRRIAERLAKMGGVNPFAPRPPQRKSTSESRDDDRRSVRKPSVDEPEERGKADVGPTSSQPQSVLHEEPDEHDVTAKDEEDESQDLESRAKTHEFEIPHHVTDSGRVEEHSAGEPEVLSTAESHPSRPNDTRKEVDLHPSPPPRTEEAIFHQPKAEQEEEEEEEAEPSTSPHPSGFVPSLSRVIAQSSEEDEVSVEQENERSDTPPPPPPRPTSPRRLPPRPVLDDDDGNASDASAAPLPHPHRRSIPLRVTEPAAEDAGAEESEKEENAGPTHVVSPMSTFVPPVRSASPTPPSPLPQPQHAEEDEQEEEVLPTPPPRRPVPSSVKEESEPPLVVPPPKRTSTSSSAAESPKIVAPRLSVSSHDRQASDDQQEILDEEEGDPIDPAFHSPSRRGSMMNLKEEANLQAQKDEPSAPAEPEEDPEQARRRTIAERMAKLGGIKFGAAPIPVPRPTPPPKSREQSTDEGPQEVEDQEEAAPALSEEEEERARKERIAAKLANMGGMRIGMMPGMMPPRAPPKPAEETTVRTPTSAHPPPQRAVPPPRAPPPPPQEPESDYGGSQGTSESDGVKVEAEDSEAEHVEYEEAQEEPVEVEAPPPLPTREGRRSSTQFPSTIAPGRPPVPPPIRKPSVPQTHPRQSSVGSPTTPSYPPPRVPHSESYVMVDEPEEHEAEEPPPPPPPRPAGRHPPARGAPPPPAQIHVPTGSDLSESMTWEMPEFNSNQTDLSLSSFDDLGPPGKAPQSAPPKSPAPISKNISADDLMAIWGRVGVQVCEVATSLHEKSKRSLIGDGSFHGFIEATLHDVPNASSVTPESYGYLIYQQTGGSVQKRVSEILPGDLIWLQDAKLKGHKGLQSYNQHIGAGGDACIGVISEFEAKKSKVRVFQANQHVGQQTVESVSYRLEDLKSGVIKIFRVLEA